MRNRIRTLKDLQAKQNSLKIQAEVSKQLFFESFGNTRRSTTDFVLKGVLLPPGAAGVAAWGAKKFFGNKNGEHTASSHSNGGSSDVLSKLLPIGLSLLNAYLTKQFVKEEVEES